MSTIERQAILDHLSRLVTPGIKLTALADDLGARKHEYAELRTQLLGLVEEGFVHVLPGGAFALAPMGRKADPHARPVPPPPPERPLKMSKKQRDQRDQREQHSATPAKAQPPKRSASLPWVLG